MASHRSNIEDLQHALIRQGRLDLLGRLAEPLGLTREAHVELARYSLHEQAWGWYDYWLGQLERGRVRLSLGSYFLEDPEPLRPMSPELLRRTLHQVGVTLTVSDLRTFIALTEAALEKGLSNEVLRLARLSSDSMDEVRLKHVLFVLVRHCQPETFEQVLAMTVVSIKHAKDLAYAARTCPSILRQLVRTSSRKVADEVVWQMVEAAPDDSQDWLDAMQALVADGTLDADRRRMLHKAAFHCYPRKVKLLLELGADPDLRMEVDGERKLPDEVARESCDSAEQIRSMIRARRQES